jgi:hypothetical protein
MSRSTRPQTLNPIALVPDITAGLIAGVLAISLQISFAALIFSADLSPQLGLEAVMD